MTYTQNDGMMERWSNVMKEIYIHGMMIEWNDGMATVLTVACYSVNQ